MNLSLQCGNMAREGLRTLVVGKKMLSEEQYAMFEVRECVYVCLFIHVCVYRIF